MLELLAAAPYPIHQYLQIRAANAGTFTPDGRAIVFASNITGTSQLWRVPRDGGWPEQLTFFDDSVRGASRSPRGNWLLFAKDQGGDERTQLFLTTPDGTHQAALTNDPKVIHHFGGWSPDGKRICFASNARNSAFFDLYVMDLASRKTTRVLQQDGTNEGVGFSPDGRSIVFARVDTPSNQNLHMLDLASGKTRLLTTHQGDANYNDVAFGRDGRLYMSSDEGREFASLATLDPRGGKLRFLTPDSVDVEGLKFDDRREWITYEANRGGYSELYVRRIGGGAIRLAHVPKGAISSMDWAPDGNSLAVAFSSPTRPSDVWRYDFASARFTQITHSSLAGIDPRSFVTPELVSYPSFDGRKIPAFWYAPKGAKPGDRLPTIVYVHGGPEGQERATFASTFQYYLNRGYGLMALNIRGSVGYGRTYTHLDDVRKRRDAIADVDYATRWLKATGWAAPDKLAVMGGSYGGYMTLACLTMLPDIWAAGVDTVGMSNMVTFLQNTGPWRRAQREAEYGSLTKDKDFLASISPINHIDKLKAPLMVIQGANDPRVPKSEADQIAAVLRARKHPVEYLLFEDEGHGVAKLKNRLVSYTKTAEFLDKYVKR